jgi:hypothetical protein
MPAELDSGAAELDERWESYRNSWEKFSGMRHVYPKLLERVKSGKPLGESLEILLVQGVDEAVQVRRGLTPGACAWTRTRTQNTPTYGALPRILQQQSPFMRKL